MLQLAIKSEMLKPLQKKNSTPSQPLRKCVMLARFRSAETQQDVQFSSRLKGWKGKLMSACYTENTPILNYFTHILSSEGILTCTHTQTCEHTHTHTCQYTDAY